MAFFQHDGSRKMLLCLPILLDEYKIANALIEHSER
jgi:hypothetical protein